MRGFLIHKTEAPKVFAEIISVPLRGKFDAEDVAFRKNWPGLLIAEIITRGSSTTLAEGVNGTDGENLPMVPSFVRKLACRRRLTANPLPNNFNHLQVCPDPVRFREKALAC